MAWTVYADPFESGDLASNVKYQDIKFPSNLLVKAIRTQLVVYGNPTVSGLKMTVYDNDAQNSEPSLLKSTSINSYEGSDLLDSQPYALKDIYFEFTPFSVVAGDTYFVSLIADSYSPTPNSYLAWRNVWPDPVYPTGITVTGQSMIYSPFMISGVVGSEI